MIHGVRVLPVTSHNDDRGFFREICRFGEHFDPFPVAQISHSMVNKGVVKGWHGHIYQAQWNYVVAGKAKVALFDDRTESPTCGRLLEFCVGDGLDPVVYFFPPGVLHGYRCQEGPMQILYVTSGVYDIEEEVRISQDYVPNATIFDG